MPDNNVSITSYVNEQRDSAYNYISGLWERIIVLFEEHIIRMNETDMSLRENLIKSIENLKKIVDLIPSRGFWYQSFISRIMNNEPGSELGVCLYGLQRSCMGISYLSIITENINLNSEDTGIIYKIQLVM